VVSGFIFSFPIGLAQWLALRRISQTSILWVLTVPLGILIYFLINGLIPEGLMQKIDDESIVVLTAAYLMIGFAVGLLQWFIMRRQFSGSLLWILGSTVGVGFSFGLILVTDLINRSGIIALIVGVLVYPITTGLILLLLLAHHKQSDTNMAYQT
jgi:signal transduction histidine kinase